MPSRSIYLVDDDASVRKALERVLRGTGRECQVFASGDEFLKKVPPTATGCVIMDISMPEMTGHDLQSKMKEAGYSLPVIVLSVNDDTESRERSRALGAVGFFRKPVDNHTLLDAIKWAEG